MKVASPVLNAGDEETCLRQRALSLRNGDGSETYYSFADEGLLP